ncbi:MAG: T9SS type A sorting domain-containing protein [Bacteroidales bacterium]|nr:T9SS type A sorting domain-containing protein [Bacteroidales bacterium]
MKKCAALFLCFIFPFLLVINEVKAENDTAYVFFSCDFEDTSLYTKWYLDNGSCANKWYIKSLNGDKNNVLFVSSDGNDSSYKNSSSTIVAYTQVDLPSADSILLEMDLNLKGEGTDYLKVFLAPLNTTFSPNTSKDAKGFATKYYKNNAFKFYVTDNYYVNDVTNGQRVAAIVENTSRCSSANLVFVWRNDNTVSLPPAPVIDNIELRARINIIAADVCKGDDFQIGNRAINQSGFYYDTLQSDDGCDSIIGYNVIIHDEFAEYKDAEICFGESYVLSDGTELTTSGQYIDSLTTTKGCDSIIYLNLAVNDVYDTVIYDTICNGTVYTKYGLNAVNPGTYSDTLQSRNGCDSIQTVILTVNDTYEKTYFEMICTGETFSRYGFNETTSGFYTHELKTLDGCDSIIHLDLRVASVVEKEIYDTICQGQIYSRSGFTATESGDYVLNLETESGCDSIVTLHLTVNISSVDADNSEIVEICQGESVEFFGKILTNSGHYEQILQNIYGCDSVVAIDLKVNPVYRVTDSVTIGSGRTYKWNGKTYSQSGDYIDTLSSINGCDSIVTLCLTVESSIFEVSNQQEISIFPNPVRNVLHIKLQSSVNQGTISLINSDGYVIKDIEITANQRDVIINSSDLPEGLYIVRIINDSFTFETKVLIL